MIFSAMKSRVRSLQFRAFYRKRTRVIADITAQLHDNKANGVMREISAREVSWISHYKGDRPAEDKNSQRHAVQSLEITISKNPWYNLLVFYIFPASSSPEWRLLDYCFD